MKGKGNQKTFVLKREKKGPSQLGAFYMRKKGNRTLERMRQLKIDASFERKSVNQPPKEDSKIDI